MSDNKAPERIFTEPDSFFYFDKRSDEYETEYIRADIADKEKQELIEALACLVDTIRPSYSPTFLRNYDELLSKHKKK